MNKEIIKEVERINKRFENMELYNIRDDFLAVEMRKILKVYKESKGGINKNERRN